MILVDTSIWIDHLRASDERMTRLLLAGQVLAHPFVIGELALGKLRNRDVVLDALQDMPQAAVASEPEVLRCIEMKGLFGSGIGYIDAHLLARYCSRRAPRYGPVTSVYWPPVLN